MSVRLIAARVHAWKGKGHLISSDIFPIVPHDIRDDVREMFLEAQKHLYEPVLDERHLLYSGYDEEDENQQDHEAAEVQQSEEKIKRRFFRGIPHQVDLKTLTPEVQKVLKVTAKQREKGKFTTGTFDRVERIADRKYEVSNTRMDPPMWLYQPNHIFLMLYRHPDLPKQWEKWLRTWEKIERYWIRKEPFENYDGKKNPDVMAMSRLRQTGYKIFRPLAPIPPETVEPLINEHPESGPFWKRFGESRAAANRYWGGLWKLEYASTYRLARGILPEDLIKSTEADVREHCMHPDEMPLFIGDHLQYLILESFELWAQENLGLSIIRKVSH